MKYLEGEELTAEEIEQGLRVGVRNANVFPVFCGSAIKNIAVTSLMDAFVDLMPNPAEVADEDSDPDAPFAGLVFKTLADPYVGKLSFIRVYKGSLTAEKPLLNANKDVEEKSDGFGGKRKISGKCRAAELRGYWSYPKLQETETGDTLCVKGEKLFLKG